MPYNYEKEKSWVFTDEGQRQFLRIRDRARELLAISGAVRADHLTAKESGDSYQQMACVDRLVELKELKIIDYNQFTPWQYQVFVQWPIQ